MRAQKVSHSAGIVAAHRAIESARRSTERICYDPLARDFLSTNFTVIGESEMPEETALKLYKEVAPGFHEFIIARARYIDDFLQDNILKGIEQLVILGAGYDSRAYRFEELKDKIRVFEVDHPATQNIKKERLCELFQKLPGHVTYVPVDFQKENLESCLTEKGYDSHLKSVFIWEGVSMYIDSKTVDETLLFISKNSGKGSTVIFDYTYPEVVAGTYERKEAKKWLEITQKSDEPLIFGIRNEHIEKFLMQRDFHNIIRRTDQYFNDTYFTGINKGRESTPILSIVHAEVKPS